MTGSFSIICIFAEMVYQWNWWRHRNERIEEEKKMRKKVVSLLLAGAMLATGVRI